MSIELTISKINRELISAFAMLDSWFDRDETVLSEKRHEKWSPAQILEHVMLTNHYLLILIEKGSTKAKTLANDADLSGALQNYQFDTSSLDDIARPSAFQWERPEHMEPKGEKPLHEIRSELREQLYRCLCHLDNLCKGEGVLYRITMSVNGLGKLDVYQYIYFLALHVKRHLSQLENRTLRKSV